MEIDHYPTSQITWWGVFTATLCALWITLAIVSAIYLHYAG